MNTPTTATVQLETLRARVAGDVIGCRDDGFDGARLAFVLAVDQAYDRLRQIEADHDPTESIISAHPVRPAA